MAEAVSAHWFNASAQAPDRVGISNAAGGSNISLVTIQFNANGSPLTTPLVFLLWLSDAANGIGLTATSASGAVAAGTAGIDLGDVTNKKSKLCTTDATGKYILSITDTGKTGFVPVVSIPGLATIMPGDALTSASYG